MRKPIGRALLNRAHDPFPEPWEWGRTTHANRAKYDHIHCVVRQGCAEPVACQSSAGREAGIVNTSNGARSKVILVVLRPELTNRF